MLSVMCRGMEKLVAAAKGGPARSRKRKSPVGVGATFRKGQTVKGEGEHCGGYKTEKRSHEEKGKKEDNDGSAPPEPHTFQATSKNWSDANSQPMVTRWAGGKRFEIWNG